MTVAQIAFGRALASTRLARGLRRKDLVDKAGISYPYLAELEDGRKRPSPWMLERLADALSVTPSFLLAVAEDIAADPRNGLTQDTRKEHTA